MNPGDQRPSLDLYFMRLARVVAQRSTCLRRAVGCVLVDSAGRVLSTGYNGVERGAKHCNELHRVLLHRGTKAQPDEIPRVLAPGDEGYDPNNFIREVVRYPHACAGARAPSGADLHLCRAVHAEQNALLQCRDVDAIHSVYVTTAPCDSCAKLFLNTNAQRFVVDNLYQGSLEDLARRLPHRECVLLNGK